MYLCIYVFLYLCVIDVYVDVNESTCVKIHIVVHFFVFYLIMKILVIILVITINSTNNRNNNHHNHNTHAWLAGHRESRSWRSPCFSLLLRRSFRSIFTACGRFGVVRVEELNVT